MICPLESMEESDEDRAIVGHYQLMATTAIAHQLQLRSNHELRYLDRQRNAGARLYNDYFTNACTYTDTNFRNRYRMRRELFVRILEEIVRVEPQFGQQLHALNVPGNSPHTKMTAAMRILTHRIAADLCDEYLRIGKTTTYYYLQLFCDTIVRHFSCRYLRKPTIEDTRRLLEQNKIKGFPGMIGSLDCMHWAWHICPTAWQGQFIGHAKGPTIILEAVSSYDDWVWHYFFGTPSSCNDLNVQGRSHIFDDLITGHAPPFHFTINGNQYDMGYYLGDGIYPRWSTIVKAYRQVDNNKKLLFNMYQEGRRKDIERTFGILKKKFKIIKHGISFSQIQECDKVMKTCIILHNMVIEDDHRDPPWQYVPDPPQPSFQSLGFGDQSLRRGVMRNSNLHKRLQNDLVEYIWDKHRNMKINPPEDR